MWLADKFKLEELIWLYVLLSILGHVTCGSDITAVLWTFVWEVPLLSLGRTSIQYADRFRGNTLLRRGTFFLNLFHFVFHQPFFHSRRFSEALMV